MDPSSHSPSGQLPGSSSSSGYLPSAGDSSDDEESSKPPGRFSKKKSESSPDLPFALKPSIGIPIKTASDLSEGKAFLKGQSRLRGRIKGDEKAAEKAEILYTTSSAPAIFRHPIDSSSSTTGVSAKGKKPLPNSSAPPGLNYAAASSISSVDFSPSKKRGSEKRVHNLASFAKHTTFDKNNLNDQFFNKLGDAIQLNLDKRVDKSKLTAKNRALIIGQTMLMQGEKLLLFAKTPFIALSETFSGLSPKKKANKEDIIKSLDRIIGSKTLEEFSALLKENKILAQLAVDFDQFINPTFHSLIGDLSSLFQTHDCPLRGHPPTKVSFANIQRCLIAADSGGVAMKTLKLNGEELIPSEIHPKNRDEGFTEEEIKDFYQPLFSKVFRALNIAIEPAHIEKMADLFINQKQLLISHDPELNKVVTLMKLTTIDVWANAFEQLKELCPGIFPEYGDERPVLESMTIKGVSSYEFITLSQDEATVSQIKQMGVWLPTVPPGDRNKENAVMVLEVHLTTDVVFSTDSQKARLSVSILK